MVTQIGESDTLYFLDNMQNKGINALILQAIERDGPGPLPNHAGDLPFTGTLGGGTYVDMTTPNEPYFVWLDQVVDWCAERDITPFLYQAYYGVEAGWGAHGDLAANGTARLHIFGAGLGTRYGGRAIWVNYADNLPNATGRGFVKDLMDGILTTDPTGVYTSHFARPSLSTDDLTIVPIINSGYSRGDSVSPRLQKVVQDGWAVSPARPVGVIENYYNHRVVTSPNLTEQQQRSNSWESRLGGALAHYFFGDEWTHGFGKETTNNPDNQPWQVYIDDVCALQLAHVKSFFTSRQWWLLTPRPLAGADLLTAGGGTLDTNGYKPRALASNGSWGAVYITDGTTCTVDLSQFSGPGSVLYFDPSNGTYHNVPTGGTTFTNSGTRAFVASTQMGNNASGGTDWVLVFDTQGGPLPVFSFWIG